MTNAQVVDGNKVLVELDWDQIDAIIKNELREHIIITHKEMQGEYFHQDDEAYNHVLFPALCVVHKHWAGEAESMQLMNELGIGHETGTD